ncbi:MAG: HEPN domain-containing protein [Treponema sp.]|jgi:HEPN domain-containing protein|nr:HEPN domain-containing protein [Treponema sp.]
MGNEYVDDDPFALFKRAEEDVAGINALLIQKEVPEEYNYVSICFHATQAVEKFVKGFIVENNGLVKKTHNLDYIQSIAENIDKNFSSVRNECLTLNEYTQAARYNDNHKIEKDEINNVLKSLNVVYHFDPIVKMREEYKKKNNYRILPEFDFLKK